MAIGSLLHAPERRVISTSRVGWEGVGVGYDVVMRAPTPFIVVGVSVSRFAGREIPMHVVSILPLSAQLVLV